MKHLLTATSLLLALFVCTATGADNTMPDSLPVDSAETAQPELQTDHYVVYYFHGNRRCATCQKLENYSHEAVTNGFMEALDSGTMVWKVVNYDEEPNQHFFKNYQLYSQSVVVSHIVDGEETEWKNLDKIWKLVGDKEEFIDYVRSETRAFMEPEPQN